MAATTITTGQVGTDAIAIAQLSATGTASSSTFLRGDNSWASPGGITLSSEQATTSGSSVTFGSIPSGTKRITIMLEGFSTGAANLHSVRIGDAGGIESSGYLACHAAAQHSSHVIATADFGFTTGTGASHRLHGVIILHLKDASNYTWIASSIVADHTGNNDVAVGGGSKSLSAELTQVQVLTAGTMGYGSIASNYD